MYIPPLTGKSDQQRFTIRSGVLTGNDTMWRSASSGSSLPEWTDFGPRSLQLHRLCSSQLHCGLHPAMFSGNDSLFVVVSITNGEYTNCYSFTYLGGMEDW